MPLGSILLLVLLLCSAQSGAAIVKAPNQHAEAKSAHDSTPDPRKQKPKFVPVPAPTNHYAFAPKQAWTV